MEATISNNKTFISVGMFKTLVFVLCLLPIFNLVWSGFQQQLGANPAETIIRSLGDWALYFVLLTLAVTPLRRVFNWTILLRVRRMLGLFVFFYACLHLIGYVWFDQFFDWNEILKDIIKRPFITLGFATFLLLLPLALTSTNKMMKRLKKNWKKLHQLVYPISVMATLHYFWMIKADFRQPALVAFILALLLGYRIYVYVQSQKKSRA